MIHRDRQTYDAILVNITQQAKYTAKLSSYKRVSCNIMTTNFYMWLTASMLTAAKLMLAENKALHL